MVSRSPVTSFSLGGGGSEPPQARSSSLGSELSNGWITGVEEVWVELSRKLKKRQMFLLWWDESAKTWDQSNVIQCVLQVRIWWFPVIVRLPKGNECDSWNVERSNHAVALESAPISTEEMTDHTSVLTLLPMPDFILSNEPNLKSKSLKSDTLKPLFLGAEMSDH